MPTYDFECSECGHRDEVIQSMSADSFRKCPACNVNKAFKIVVLTPPNTFVKEVKTVAQQAEKNTKSMGKYELEERRLKDDLNNTVSKKHKEARERHKSIISMTPQQQQHWIKTGEKPK